MKAIVTGASSGIGASISKLLRKENLTVVLVGRCIESLQKVSDQYNDFIIYPCDLSRASAVDQLLEMHPETDVLINCAGFAQVGNFSEQDWESIRCSVEVNALVVAQLCHHYLPGMKKRGYGKILNISSSVALATSPGYGIYSASKAFILQLSRSLAAELVGTGVSVSCLLPGPTATDFCRRAGIREAPNAMSSETVAKYGLYLLEKGIVIGTPGIGNKLKQALKQVLPARLGSYIAKRYLRWRVSHANL